MSVADHVHDTVLSTDGSQQTMGLAELNQGAVSNGAAASMERPTVACATLGGGARLAGRDRRFAAGGVYCAPCHAVVHAVYHGGDVLGAALVALQELTDVLAFVEPFPNGLPCIACCRARAAQPGTVWCSPTCRRRVWSFGHRGFRLVNLGGVVLPEKVWRLLRGLRESTYRTRRIEVGVIEALVVPLDAGRSRSARASVAARRGLPPPDDGLEVRDLIRSMTPRIRTLT